METLGDLKKRLAELDEEIKETRRRLPAHSVKPPVMMDLLALEDAYDDIMQQIETLKKGGTHEP
jgi:hypothetical protein